MVRKRFPIRMGGTIVSVTRSDWLEGLWRGYAGRGETDMFDSGHGIAAAA